LIVCLLSAAFLYLVEGGVSVTPRGPNVSPYARAHLMALGALVFVLIAFRCRLAMYDLLYSARGIIYGAGYSDVVATLPVLKILLFLSLVTGLMLLIGGLRGGAYSAAKGGLTALTTHIACQYGASGIRCNAVAPGVTVTPMVEKRLEDERFRKINTEMTPHQRLATVDDIASTIAFLCSEGGSFINGQTIVVDGGWSSTKYLSDFALTSEWVPR